MEESKKGLEEVKKFYQARFNRAELKMQVGYLTCLISQKVQLPVNLQNIVEVDSLNMFDKKIGG
jgi:hypothetical protein